MNKKLLFASMLCHASLILAADSDFNSSKINSHCDLSKGNQQQINLCSRAKYEAAEQQMFELYWQKMGQLSKKTQAMLSESQLAWEKYRDSSCAYEVDFDGPCEGSICPLLKYQCETRFTKERIKVLKHYLTCDTGGCPE